MASISARYLQTEFIKLKGSRGTNEATDMTALVEEGEHFLGCRSLLQDLV